MGYLGITPVVPHFLMLKLIIVVFSSGNFLFPGELNIVRIKQLAQLSFSAVDVSKSVQHALEMSF